ncbi:MAG: hypothetical protein K6G94_08010 [Kiritimatiellae bacterium]|nr:hypothetical protein [Kiritimatiellia bacterium]
MTACADEGQEPAFVKHGGNVVRCADNSVQIWAEVGYKGTNGVAWADEAIIKYRIDSRSEGTSRCSGVTAVSSSAAHAADDWADLTNHGNMSMQSLVADDSGKGRAMMWMATVTDDQLADSDAVLVYEIYARNNSGTAEWKQAEYDANDGEACTFEYRMWSYGSGDLTVDGVPADNTTSKFFLDEDTTNTVSVKVEYTVPDDAEAVEVFTNFGRRNYADADVDKDGQPDALVPPDRDSVTSDNCADGYWQAIAMENDDGVYTATLTATNCGVYRITARYRSKGAEDWTWYSDGPNGAERRDHAVVISPKKARDAIIYEIDSTSESYTNLAEKLAVNTLRFKADDSSALDFASLCDSASLDTILSCDPSAYPTNLVEGTSLDGISCTSPTNHTTLFWEYCINRARKAKWDFLFMANVPEGGETGFLYNRQFDILEETIVFRFTEDHISYAAQLKNVLEYRRAAYGDGLVLLNEGSLAEPLVWEDPQCVVSSYAMLAALDGVPMMFHEQETTNTSSSSAPNDTSAMTALYKRINLARQNSPALRSQNRYLSGGNSKILFCAKWTEDGANPNEQDSVFAAALFLNDSMDGALNGHWGNGQWYNISSFAAKMGIENRADRYYNVVNIASTSTNFLWETPRSGRDLYENQLFLGLQGSWKWDDYNQTTEHLACSEWGDNGYVVQYLKVVDVTAGTTPTAPDDLTLNDPIETITLAYGTTSYNVVGMAGENVEGNVTWKNPHADAGGSFAAATVWTNSVPLETGTNVITFSAATAAPLNEYAVLASVSGAEFVEGFDDFSDGSTPGGAGYSICEDFSGIDLTGFTDDTSFYLWANLGCSASVTRKLTEYEALTSVSVDVGMLWDSGISGAFKGVEFLDAGNNVIFGVKMENSGTIVYYGANGTSGTWSEDSGDQVFTITITKTATNDGYTYAVSGTTRSGGTFSEIVIETDAELCAFRAFMDGVNDDEDKAKRALYFDNLRYTVPASESSKSTATATIVVLPPETRNTPVAVPYSWLDGYSLGDGTSSGYDAAAVSKAANGLNSVWECYVAGLDPTNETSKLTATISFDAAGNPVIGIDPSRPDYTPDEWYEVQGKTNVTDATWGSTNSMSRFFRVLINTP